MSDEVFNFNEFIEKKEKPAEPELEEAVEEEHIAELDVQKAVVEEFAAEKAEMEEALNSRDKRIVELEDEVSSLKEKITQLEHKLCQSEEISACLNDEKAVVEASLDRATAKNAELEEKINERLIKELDDQVRNPNALALLDRDVDLPDRFPGETRDHVLEVIKEARDEAEKTGRIRRAQLLEGVLVANEPNGGLAKKRANLEKFFTMNANIISGPVIEELERCGISYKEGDTYLLPKEILLRTY